MTFFIIDSCHFDSLVSWPMAFYVHAALNAFFFTLWTLVYRDSAHSHPLISRKEMLIVGRQRSISPVKTPQNVSSGASNMQMRPCGLQIPYLTLFRARSVIAVYVAVVGNFITFNFANTQVANEATARKTFFLSFSFFPSYLHTVLGVPILPAGLIPAGVLLGQVGGGGGGGNGERCWHSRQQPLVSSFSSNSRRASFAIVSSTWPS